MSRKWDKYSRLSLDVAFTATSIGFSAAKASTKLGFSITRGIVSTAADLTGTVIDHALFGGHTGAGPLLGGAVSTAISAIETLALAPIVIGESLTSTSLVAAHSSLSILTAIFPGSDEASFSLASFVQLVKREWSDPIHSDSLPEERFTVTDMIKGLAGWASLQGVTSQWQERQWFEAMREIQMNDQAEASPPESRTPRTRVDSGVHITADVIYPSRGGQIVTADIGEASVSPPVFPLVTRCSTIDIHPNLSNLELKRTLRRLSKLTLAGYGGASLLFFGASPWSAPLTADTPDAQKLMEETNLTNAVDASEAEASPSSRERSSTTQPQAQSPGGRSYSWWDVMLGRHDHDIFMQTAHNYARRPIAESSTSHTESQSQSHRPLTAFVGSEYLMPRFWVLTDHVRCEVVLVIRGTMSLNELAVDLTCEAIPFELHVPRSHRPRSRGRAYTEPVFPSAAAAEEVENAELDAFDEELESIPGAFPIDLSTPYVHERPLPDVHERPQSTTNVRWAAGDEEIDDATHWVHGGIYKMARVMGSPGRPVHVAVRDALKRNKEYSLVLCGHSLGAGVAALLALMWADPYTRLTHRRSRLPQNRQVSVYCFAPPCLTSSRLGTIAAESGLITSFVYAHDVVSRLALGSVRDLTIATAWLCKAEVAHGEGWSRVTKRAMKWKAGYGKEGDEEWFLAMRKTLEANMQMAQLFPPGLVLWAVRDEDLHPEHRLHAKTDRTKEHANEKVRLFHVLDVKRAFGQIIFAKDMLSSHMPHQYDRALHELL